MRGCSEGLGAEPPEANGGLGANSPAAGSLEAELPVLGDFYNFFKAYLDLNFCFKTCSDNS